MKTWRMERLKINRLVPAEYNPRVITRAALQDLAASLDEFGVVQPIVWNERTGNVVGGHQRLKVLLARGEIDVDCVVVDLPVEKEKALNVVLNNGHAQGEFTDALQVILADLKVVVPELLSKLNLGVLVADTGEEPAIVENPLPPAPPRLAWILIAVPLESFIEVSPLLEAVEKIQGAVLETTVTN